MSASFPEAERFYKSAAWVKASRAYRNRMNHLCERCNRPGAYVHHKTYLTPANIGNPQITLNADNCYALSVMRRNITGRKQKQNAGKYYLTVRGGQ